MSSIKYKMGALCLILLSSIGFNAYAEEMDHVIAVVNENVITAHELNKALQFKRLENPMAFENTPVEKRKKETLTHLIDISLTKELAEKNKISVTNAEIQKIIQNIADANHLPLSVFKEKIESQGITFKDYETQLQAEVLHSRVAQVAIGPIEVKAEDITRYAKGNTTQSAKRIVHLADFAFILKDNPSAEESATTAQKATRFKKAIEKNENAFKEDPDVHASDLGWRKDTEIPMLFLKAVEAAKVGQIIGPIKAANGYHLLKLLEEKNEQSSAPQLSPKDEAYQVKKRIAIEAWLEKLRAQSYIKIR